MNSFKRYISGILTGIVLLLGWSAQEARAQEPLAYIDYVRTELDWYTIETQHFLVHYHGDESGEGSRTARVVARIAEDIYAPITSLYELEPDTKVSFILKDYEDYSNGAAYFFDNVIEIWAPALQTPFRGNHNWLRNVITHEFLHMIQVQKTMKASRKLPFVYLQYLDYEAARRPDVLYGFPNVIASYPVPILNNPAWLAEGTAQFQRADFDYDRWDSHRDMLLRTQVLAGEELTLEEMGGFYSHNSLERESVYNHGYAFSRYLADRFGEEALMELSASLGSWTNWNMKQAAKDAFGIRGEELYRDWMASLREHYQSTSPKEMPVDVVEPEGFHNYWPTTSPDGSKLAYVSNRGEDFSRSGIWVKDLTAEAPTAEARLLLDHDEHGVGIGYTCSLGHKLVPVVSGSVSWTPDGEHLVYSKTRDTSEGFIVLDLYRVHVETGEKTRLSEGLRASMPNVSPDGSTIAMVIQNDGSTNLAVADMPVDASDPMEPADLRYLTEQADGGQITDPVWSPDGTYLYFGWQRDHGRDIRRVEVATGVIEVIMDGPEDERNPSFDTLGRLVYASDRTGIFNLYRLNEDSSSFALTDVQGGAFMPEPQVDGSVIFSDFTASGYHIARVGSEEAMVASNYSAPAFLTTFDVEPPTDVLMAPPSDADSEIRAFDAEEQEAEASRYDPVFTSISFLPVLRVDQYVSRERSRTDERLPDRTRGETLWRNAKVGMYASTREVLGGMSFFGGLLVGPGSTDASSPGDFFSPANLLDLERDGFLQIDYSRGLPFIKGRWNPHISAQVFNIRRQVENGLEIEEFPCTACFPESTFGDLTYNLWEVNLLTRSKISRSMLAELGYRYSPYRVKTNSFFSKELDLTVPSSSSRYFIGRAWTARWTFEGFHPHINSDVVPDGIRAELEFDTETGRLLEAFDISDGILQPVYASNRVNRFTFTARGGMRLPGWTGPGTHGIGFRMRASTILGEEVDDFYNDFVGGMTGARGYPFYALGGNETWWTGISYLFPIAPRISKHAQFLYLGKVYGRIFADAAMAWSGAFPGLSNMRKDVGAEVRVGLGSFYLLPTALFVSAAYGMDEFDFELDEGFVTPDGRQSVRYGKEWQWHFGVLFGFDQF
jgi:Tol biopolymer transport system component